MAISYECFIPETFFKLHIDAKYASGNFRYGIDNQYYIDLIFSFHYASLRAQAGLFSTSVSSHKDSIDIKRFFGSRSGDWNRWLYQTYIYSFAKAFFHGIYSSEIKYDPENSYVFYGHGVLKEVLSRNSFMWQEIDGTESCGIILNIKLSKDRDDLMDELITNFPFLRNCMNRGSGNYSFLNPTFEGCLNSLNYQCSSSNNFVSSGERPFVEDKEDETISKSNFNMRKKKTPFVIEIGTLGHENFHSSVSNVNLAIGNSFYSLNKKVFYHIMTNSSSVRLRRNQSLFLGRALGFLCPNLPVVNGNGFYRRYLINGDVVDHLIGEDLYSVTGIKNDGGTLSNTIILEFDTVRKGELGYVHEDDVNP